MSSIENILRRLREGRLLQEQEDYSSKSTEELVKLVQDNDDQLALETLMDTHKDFLKRMTNKYFMRGADKDDIDQMARIAFWDAISSYDPDKSGSFEAFAGMIIKRSLAKELEKDQAGKRQIHNLAQSLDATLSNEDGEESSIGDMIPSKGESPEEHLLGKEGAKELIKFMKDNFTSKERDVIMRYIKGDKIPQIAEETGVKYKSVENALMRIRNKLKDYLKNSQRESKSIRETSDIEFSDEEKKVLESVISKINEQENKLRESYGEYTEEQIDSELENIEYEIEEIDSSLEDSDYDYDEVMDRLEELRDKVNALEEYIPDDQVDRFNEIYSSITSLKKEVETRSGGSSDPYADRGLKRSDFF